jgi:hypothetical protein
MAAYDMNPRPQPGQEVEVTYRAIWACWDPINRPITKPAKQPDTSRFLAPRDAVVRIVDEDSSVQAEHTVTLSFESETDAIRFASVVAEHGGVCIDESCLGMDDVPLDYLPATIVPPEGR